MSNSKIMNELLKVKWIKNMSLRARLTIITATILTIICVAMTLFALYNVDDTMYKPINDFGTRYFIEGNGRIYRQTPYVDFNDVMSTSRHNLSIKVYLAMFSFITLGSVGMYYFAGKALKPVTNFSKDINKINEYNLGKRLEVPETNDELASLSNSFNEMITKLERAFDSQKRFSQNAAHELKTPLTTMMTNIEVLEMDDSPSQEEYKDLIAVMKSSTERLIELVNALLKINTNGAQTIEEIELKNLLDALLDEYSSKIKEKKINVEIKGEAKVYADLVLMERLFSNVLLNAIRYNKDEGSINISIDKDKIIIRDSGIGMEEEKLHYIFEPFYCVDNSRSKMLGGTGVGLSIVKEIIDLYKLNYNVESKVDEGTTFTIYLKNISQKKLS
ncbi:MAG: HAMP domain-containing sensor histidine kinase [Erysipelotrichales bacterium]